ncbi:MAG TPA: endonuclease/exonuclease/phosphatase family protein [Blastocatellia bacterium]|nr:endonuclease/exonuclease/phosphatase family protein [Blastocatellia bacterium]
MARSFRIASYNVLADSYVKPQWYPNVDPEVLRWDRRKFALAERVLRLDADIICLQEVETDAYALIEHRLGAKAYEGVYAKKGCDKPDGCAMFFRPGELRFLGSETIYYRDSLRGVPDSGHLALIISFESEWGVIRVATTHLRWGQEDMPPEEHIGYLQIRELISNHFKPDRTAEAWVVCGDLNVRPDNPVVKELISSGFLDAYAGREQATCNPNGRAKRIDYIFHTSGLRAEPSRIMEIDDLTPLPNPDEPSDHLAIMATFEQG